MRYQPRQFGIFAFALGIAVAGAALIGFLVSRPRTPLIPVTPTPLTTVVAPMGPPATAGYSVADDIATKQVVVFGGIADNQATWLWNGSLWSLAQPATSPPGRIDAAAAYDPALHLVLLFGGHGPPGTDLSDTWAWGGANWRELDRGTDAPPPSDAVMAWDPAVKQMVLVAGAPTGASTGTWIWSGIRWTPLASALPFSPSSVSLAYDPSTRQLLAAAIPVVGTTGGASAQTWAWDGAAWHDLTAGGAPLGKTVVGLGWDPPNQQLLLFSTGVSEKTELDTWERNGIGWRESSTIRDAILSGVIVSAETSLLLVGAVDTGAGVPTSIEVWAWAANGWTPA
jgi:hypothetical protein